MLGLLLYRDTNGLDALDAEERIVVRALDETFDIVKILGGSRGTV